MTWESLPTGMILRIWNFLCADMKAVATGRLVSKLNARFLFEAVDTLAVCVTDGNVMDALHFATRARYVEGVVFILIIMIKHKPGHILRFLVLYLACT